MKRILILGLLLAAGLRAQIPVTDLANLANNQLSELENLAKWVESIAQLKTQITQLNAQISLQTDLRAWTGDPTSAGGKLALNALGVADLVRDYGRAKELIRSTVNSIDSLKNSSNGDYRVLVTVDLDGNEVQHDALAYRRYSVLDATQQNTAQVTTDTKVRVDELQDEIAATLAALKAAPTLAESEKHAAKLNVLNGQLAEVEATRRREVDAVVLQKIANDSRQEEERQAAAELAAKDDYLANQRVSNYLKTIHLRKETPDAP